MVMPLNIIQAAPAYEAFLKGEYILCFSTNRTSGVHGFLLSLSRGSARQDESTADVRGKQAVLLCWRKIKGVTAIIQGLNAYLRHEADRGRGIFGISREVYTYNRRGWCKIVTATGGHFRNEL